MRHNVRQTKMRPLQVWLPTLAETLSNPKSRRDAQRAMQAWQGEGTVWLLPKLKKSIRWYEGKGKIAFPVLAIPAETTDRLDIYHVGENGKLWGRGAVRFPSCSVDSLLDAWLNLGNIPLYRAPKTIALEIPRVKGKRFIYREEKLRFVPVPAPPIYKADKKTRTVITKWPPEGKSAVPVFPEEEIAEYYGPQNKKKWRGLSFIMRWPKPFGELLPNGGGTDLLYANNLMRAVSLLSEEDPSWALKKAIAAAAPHVFDGNSSLELSWFFPAVLQTGFSNALLNVEDRLGADTAKLFSTQWQEKMCTSIPIRRAYGVQGLMWALLLDRLESGIRFRSCRRCGRIIKGKKGKEVCGREDNEDCFKKRRAADKRRERNAD